MLEKAFLTSLNKVESVGLTFVSLKDVYVISQRKAQSSVKLSSLLFTYPGLWAWARLH